MSENGQTPPPTPEIPVKAKTKPLTNRQRNYIKIKATHPELPETEVKRRAGYAESTALKNAEIGKNRNVQERVRAALEAQGLTDEFLAQKVWEGTQAYKATYINRTDGIVEKKDIDFYSRHKAVELSYKLRGEIIDRAQNENTFPEGIPLVTDPAELKSLERQYGHIFGIKKKRVKK